MCEGTWNFCVLYVVQILDVLGLMYTSFFDLQTIFVFLSFCLRQVNVYVFLSMYFNLKDVC